MFGLSTVAHKKHIQSVKRSLKKIVSSSANLAICNKATELFFGGMSVEEIQIHENKHWANVIVDFVKSIGKIPKGTAIVRVFNPSTKTHGYENHHTVIQVSCQDMPFLVDSVALAFNNLGLDMELMTHPVAHLNRNKAGVLQELLVSDVSKESWMHIEISKIIDPAKIADLVSELELVINKINACVSDWQSMLVKMDEAKEAISSKDDKKTHIRQIKFLNWLLSNNFTFLGYQYYQLKTSGESKSLVAKKESALGLYSASVYLNDIDVMTDKEYQISKQSDLLIITKLNARPRVHRASTLDYIGVVVVNANHEIIGEHRFVGLFTSAAINSRPWDIPYINDKVNRVIKRFQFEKASHTGKHIIHIMESLPRDELMQSSSDELYATIYSILTIQESQKSNVTVRQDKFKRFYAFLVHIPRDKFNTNVRHTIQNILAKEVTGSHIEFQVKIEESDLTRLYVTVYSKHLFELDTDDIEQKISNALKSWQDELEELLLEKYGKDEGYALAQKYAGRFPLSYEEEVTPKVAVYDVENAAKLSCGDGLELSLYHPRNIESKIFRFKIFRCENTIPLSDVLPILENMGLRVVRERPYKIGLANGSCFWIQDFDLSLAHGAELELGLVKYRFKEAFRQIVNGVVDNDAFNKLLILGGLTSRQIIIIRAISKYLKQTNLPFSQDYLEKALISQAHISRWLIELFGVKFAISLDALSSKQHKDYLNEFKNKFALQLKHLNIDLTEHQHNALDEYFNSTKFNRKRQEKKVIKVVKALLDSVSSQDEDNIIRAYTEVILAILRTNFYQTNEDGEFKAYVSFKLESAKVPQMPKPIPFREIFAYSPRFEAIHLRMGEVARGGLRWSDRYEDFRTEVLGLMKAQNVKNSIIVPVGSKGGFVVKQIPTGSRDEVMAEVICCYQNFIRSMLDLTDNIVAGKIIHPKNVIRYDKDDPYLVVAADKGTATFSDIANGISKDYGHWLGDAFASGGSVGYDHKAMGITAKGAWESVKRHFRELGIDCQNEDFSVVGIGDMMGDVFGNGMLLSKHICLKAAFNHMHIFLDPNPDSAKSWIERDRLFKLPRSNWEDYNQDLISKGGGVFSRFDKSITLSTEIKKWLGITVDELSPQELIKTLLKSPVDLLWNGGIGTYVKANSESHEEVGDSANNSLRVDGKDLRCGVIGEGGNLGCTQLGRIEYAQRGGKINTDFIDNSAGVDCSDHEVNIKILVQSMLDEGKYDAKSRVKLLESMTENVSKLVLRNNYSQTQTLSMMEYHSRQRLGAKTHLIQVLEKRGLLDREIEFLPTNQQLKQRQAEGKGLSRPELCVLLSYAKLALFEDLLASDVLADKWFVTILREYFPDKLQKTEIKYLLGHRLHREIVATILTSQIIDRMGATFMQRTYEDTGANVGAIAQAYVVAVELFGAEDLWKEIEQLDLVIKPKHQIEGGLIIWNHSRQAVRWILNKFGHNFDISTVIKQLQTDIAKFTQCIGEVLPQKDLKALNKRKNLLAGYNYPQDLANNIAYIEFSFAALDVVEIATKTNQSVAQAAVAFFALGEKLNLLWLRDMIEKLVVIGPWHAHARGVLRDELFEYHNSLTQTVLNKYASNGSIDTITNWINDNKASVKAIRSMLQQIRSEKISDYATVMVAVRSINNLVIANQ
ncbi:NAD-specific glutamate dehydrogenase, large form [hydrothermal vent metagenome]|uniref:NAD-specific glutamate dehydrogenase, large form n=1 Tax=hydrothermal vent metagenome TaxID=652676 RepID=A0A3B0URX8_9ZZZZ